MNITSEIIKERINSLKKILEKKNIDSILISNPENRYYLSGFTGDSVSIKDSAGILVVTKKKTLLFTNGCFFNQANLETFNCSVVSYESDVIEKIFKYLSKFKIKNIAFEIINTSYATYLEYVEKSIKYFKKNILKSTNEIVEKLREVKSYYEIEQTRNAVKLAETAFLRLIQIIKVGMSERKVAYIFEKIIYELSSEKIPFSIIVASGINSSMPHFIPSNKILLNNEPILLDWGVNVNGYCSDISRTIIFGSPDDKFINLYDIVLNAQVKSINKIKSGVKANFIDKISRQYIEKKQSLGRFLHGLGHGTGLEIHESPKIYSKSTNVLKSNMIITIEPGIYVEDWGGIRLENQVLVNENDCTVLNTDDLNKYKIGI